MRELFDLAADIAITENVVAAIRNGCPPSPDLPDPIASIELVTPALSEKPGYWVLSWFSKNFAPSEMLFRVSDVELFLSVDAQSKLRGKIIDIENGRVVFHERRNE